MKNNCKYKLIDKPDYEVYIIGPVFFFQRGSSHPVPADHFLLSYSNIKVLKLFDKETEEVISKVTKPNDPGLYIPPYYRFNEDCDFIQSRFYIPQPGDTAYYTSACKMPRKSITNFKRASKEKATFFVIPQLPYLSLPTKYYTFVNENVHKIFLVNFMDDKDYSRLIGKTIGESLKYVGETDYEGNMHRAFDREETNLLCNVVGLRDAVCTGNFSYISSKAEDIYIFDFLAGKMDKIIYEKDFIKLVAASPITMEKYNTIKDLLSSNSYNAVSLGMQTLSHSDYSNYPGLAKKLLYDTERNWSLKLYELDKATKFMFDFFKIRGISGHVYGVYDKISKLEFEDVKKLLEADIREKLLTEINYFKNTADANINVNFSIEITKD